LRRHGYGLIEYLRAVSENAFTKIDLDLRSADWLSLPNGHHWRGYAWLDGVAWTPVQYRNENPATLLPRLNGCFSWVGQRADNGFLFAASDRLGSYPLFYGAGRLMDQLHKDDLRINQRWLDHHFWRYSEALPGDYTLDDRYRSLRPFSLLEWKARKFLTRSLYQENLPPQRPAKADIFRESVLAACRRMMRWADGRTLVVLLSDGYDSRLILAALYELGYPAIAAATYGVAGNGVVERGREICRRLGVPFHFIDYAAPEHADFLRDHYPRVVEYCANGQSVPQEQEIYAAYELRQRLGPEAVLVPGISGDLQAEATCRPILCGGHSIEVQPG